METAPASAQTEAHWSARTARAVTERVVVEGELVLTEPAHFGNGDEGDVVDMPLLMDGGASGDAGRPLLTGDSIAGALRSHLRRRTFGHRAPLPDPGDDGTWEREKGGPAVQLLGGVPGDDDGRQSPLIVEDALGQRPSNTGDATRPGVEVREGVSLDARTRTAEDGKLFDLEAWAAGTRFPLRFELLIAEHEDAPDPEALRRALCTALEGLGRGDIPLGARKRRGYGKAEVQSWRVRRYDLTDPQGLLDWLRRGDCPLEEQHKTPDLRDALGVAAPLADRRTWFAVDATFALDGSLLIRSSHPPTAESPDDVYLQAFRPDGDQHPVLSGTSLAGALRARARKIARTLAPRRDEALALVNEMFGAGPDSSPPGGEHDSKNGSKDDKPETSEPHASRLETRETVICGAETNLVQSRVSIDRFTGGAYPGALFDQQPVFGDDDTRLRVELRLVKPSGGEHGEETDQAGAPYEAEVGLLLLLLKDLWTSDLPLGGENTIGRGRLVGKDATLTLRENGDEQSWQLDTSSGPPRIEEEARDMLNGYVEALNEHLRP